MSEFPYSDQYNPPAPICQVNLLTSRTCRKVTVEAMLDTGADATLIPLHHLTAIGAKRAYATGLRSQWGESRKVYLFLVDIQIVDFVLPGQYVVGDDIGQECVLGRNVLNRLRISLDGPGLSSNILP